MDACAHMAESLCCSPETSTTLLTGYTSTQTFKENFVTVFIKIPTEDGITGLSAHSPNRRSVTLIAAAAAAAESLQSCPTLSDPMDCSLPGSPSLGFSRQEYWSGCPCLLQCRKVKGKSLSRVRLCATPWTAAHQAPPSLGFSRQEYWSGCPCLLRL